MVIRGFIVADRFPVDSLRRSVGVRVLLYYFRVELFGVCPFLLHEADAGQAQQKLRGKFFFRQIAFNAVALFAVFVEHQRRGCPDRVKAMEAGGVFLDVDGEWNESLVDIGRELWVGVRFGFQPSACASSRCGAEIEQNGLVLCLRLSERGINIFVPGNSHGCTSRNELLRQDKLDAGPVLVDEKYVCAVNPLLFFE